jgi:putative two-component system response regulator
MPHEKAVEIIREGRGTQFDPIITDAMLRIQDKFREPYLDSADPETQEEAPPAPTE